MPSPTPSPSPSPTPTSTPTPVIEYETISIIEAKNLIDSEPSLMILDVRTEAEFEEAHLGEAVNIPLNELEKRIKELDKEKAILVYCRTGARSAQASDILVENGY